MGYRRMHGRSHVRGHEGEFTQVPPSCAFLIKEENMRKTLSVILAVFIFIGITSCSYDMKAFSRQVSYSDPQTIGGKWDITTVTGQLYEDCECIYWGMDDDTAMFRLPDGRVLALSGSYSLIQSN